MAHRLFAATLAWTLALLLLGSIVHATESSLACPDWPTCFGTMTPEMTGGVFWEHLHRLWAGALVLLFIVATVVLWRQAPPRPSLQRTTLAGIALLLIQSVLGGLTVIYRLPDAISTSHLALAFLFLGLLTVLTVVTSRGWQERPNPAGSGLLRVGLLIAGLVFAQSILGALVRHTDAGVACPDVPLCLGRVIPPLDHWMVQLHFGHRALGLALAATTVAAAVHVLRTYSGPVPRRLVGGLLIGVLAQVALGFLSVAVQLHPAAVSTHTLLAAGLLSMSVALAAWGWAGAPMDGAGAAPNRDLHTSAGTALS